MVIKMKRKIRYGYNVLQAALAILMLTACTKQVPEEVFETQEMEEAVESEKTHMSEETLTDTEETEERALTREELSFFTEYVNAVENNGFLASAYSSCEEIDLDEVLYNGAGIQEELTEELKQLYVEINGGYELQTDLLVLKADKIDAFLKKKTGLVLQEFTKPLEYFLYAPEYDMYFKEHGDTNMVMFECKEGRKTADGRYVLTCRPREDSQEQWVTECTVTLYKEGEEYQFCSNEVTAGYYLEYARIDEMDISFWDNYTPTADVSAIRSFTVWGDTEQIIRENLYGTWYDPDMGEAIMLSEDGARVYIPYLNQYGTNVYNWEIEYRQDKGLCPAVYIYSNGEENGLLAYYIGGVNTEEGYFWCNGQQQIFYKMEQ